MKASMAFNSVEVKYMATSIDSCEAIWLCKLIVELIGEIVGVYYGLM
jgi:hypothetical protein